MIKGYDSQVRGKPIMKVSLFNSNIINFIGLDVEKDLFVDIGEFMKLQGREKEISDAERIELIRRIKQSFVATLTHYEEKVALANQCYNSVEKHLIKMEEDLKCFEEEIRLSGYADLLEKVQEERRRQRQQIRAKNRAEIESSDAISDGNGDGDGSSGEGDNNSESDGNGGENDFGNEDEVEASRKQSHSQSQSQPQSQSRKSNSKKKRPQRGAIESTSSSNPKRVRGGESDEEAAVVKMSRAERLLRRNRPNYVEDSIESKPDKMEQEEGENQQQQHHQKDEKEEEEVLNNQGDDEAEEEDEDKEDEEIDRKEEEDDDDENENFTDFNEESSQKKGLVKKDDLKFLNVPFDKNQHHSSSGSEDNSNSSSSGSISSGDGSISGKNPSPNSSSSSRSTRRQSSKSINSNQPQQQQQSQPQQPVYCTCKKPSYGQMIACDGKSCDFEWFHYECVGLKSPPKGKWYCRKCQESLDAKTAAQMQSGMSTRSSRRQ